MTYLFEKVCSNFAQTTLHLFWTNICSSTAPFLNSSIPHTVIDRIILQDTNLTMYLTGQYWSILRSDRVPNRKYMLLLFPFCGFVLWIFADVYLKRHAFAFMSLPLILSSIRRTWIGVYLNRVKTKVALILKGLKMIKLLSFWTKIRKRVLGDEAFADTERSYWSYCVFMLSVLQRVE